MTETIDEITILFFFVFSTYPIHTRFQTSQDTHQVQYSVEALKNLMLFANLTMTFRMLGKRLINLNNYHNIEMALFMNTHLSNQLKLYSRFSYLPQTHKKTEKLRC